MMKSFLSDMATPVLHGLVMPTAIATKSSRKVAVIGAGAAGLVAARELRREGHNVVVFERSDRVGGTWVYDANVESDPMGLHPSRAIIHSSLYDSLRTNLPRQVMGFLDFPFVVRDGKDRDPRRFPGHREVLLYLEDFARHFELTGLIRFDTEVFHIGLVEEGKWILRSRKRTRTDTDAQDDLWIEAGEIYDAVVVCNGHYTEPRIAEIPGVETWPGKQMHSHNYRIPEPFRDQVVVLIGSSASAVDISMDIAVVAKEVHISSRSATPGEIGKLAGYDNMWLHSMVERAQEDGTVAFQDGSFAHVDVILHCTGYRYHFPFLEMRNILSVDDNRVGPLYKHIFPPSLAPWLSFIGLPFMVVPFPLFELQSRWVAGILSGRFTLPSEEEMMEDVKDFYSKIESAGWPKRYTHKMGDSQFVYNDWLATQCGCSGIEEWKIQMYHANRKNRVDRPKTYRDVWDDEHLILQADEYFRQYSNGGNM
ncbi:PREDICTED: flavin-containing monooxygenase FMO GS-OX-like 3 [Nelumbo nucifera]|uniref:Flavin-containing monooxygenase n=1 Tax=Nelumbo nucifera TaxID=4432 RepID=A0A1U7ZWY7_NELNU|nr:PREDICTED: flavin-containing monooxygenase FMO GS-OX-like 3 [Nelumbo nucifera]